MHITVFVDRQGGLQVRDSLVWPTQLQIGAPQGALAMAAAAGSAQAAAEGMEEELLPPVEQRRVDHEHEVGRNDPCWCGSGKKFKKCHGA